MADSVYPKTDPARGVPAAPSFPELEERVLAHWAADGTFEASVEARPAGENGSNEFVFYDGPPFANGLPHYGHLLTGYVKDVVPRYQTMRGRRVERRFGWDTHGLPAEVEAEKQLGISGKPEIVAMGVDRFNEACRTSVLRYTEDWRRYVTRQARWVDFDNDYKTLDLSYMESVLWAFKTLFDKGLIYEGFRVLPYCWRCETPLSNTETRMDDVYRARQDPAVTVAFTLETGEKLLVWTTTPWTLPSNLAIAVGPDIDYAVLAGPDGTRYVLGESRVDAYAAQLGEYQRVGTLRGEELVGRRYTPLFDFLADTERFGTENAFRVLPGEFVTTEDGTGVVHMAPAYGEDDQNTCAAHGIPVVMTVDDHTRFTSVVPDFEGLQVFEANKPIVAALRERGVLVRLDSYEHPYPHCWRCDTPLVYKAVSSWFVEVTKFRDRMVELNSGITWVPEHIQEGAFGKWLANARDWSISRNRFWGSPIPVWKSDDPDYPRVDVYGSLDEFERDFGVRPTDLHRPYVDDLVRPNPDDPTGQSTMRRVPEVLDCWFESGSMPFAQVHYPFENREWFEHHYPGDFIVEYIAQTRGWFYTLHVLATALFDRPAFRSAVSHGIVQGDDGRKMSKSLRNYPDVYEMFDSYGSDAMRWFLMSSPILRGGDLSVTETGIRDSVRQVLNPLWNAWYFFTLYANADGHEARSRVDSAHVLDRYVLAKLHDTVAEVTAELDVYDISGACATVRDFLDALTNWYIRRSRDRFWASDAEAFDTLYTVLETVTRVMAPLLPMVAEEIWRGLTGGRSVHLTDFPSAAELPADPELVRTMDRVREIASATLSLRKASKLRVRLPLAELVVVDGAPASLEPFAAVVADEVNVKSVRFLPAGDDVEREFGITRRLTVNARAAGPRLGKDVQVAIRGSKSGDWSVSPDGQAVAGGIALQEGEYTLELVAGEGSRATTVLPGEGYVALDTAVTPELAAEGVARDVIRGVASARRDAGLDVSDRIRLVLEPSSDEIRAAVETHRDFVAGETLATALELGDAGADAASAEVGDGGSVRIAVTRV
ncbi:MAG TPA: isoleucine--tRNA ligase [Mycobacteriales bacterium]|nr:isoleucine--tRNA ligase [Mycobacteriales bacterium]